MCFENSIRWKHECDIKLKFLHKMLSVNSSNLFSSWIFSICPNRPFLPASKIFLNHDFKQIFIGGSNIKSFYSSIHALPQYIWVERWLWIWNEFFYYISRSFSIMWFSFSTIWCGLVEIIKYLCIWNPKNPRNGNRLLFDEKTFQYCTSFIDISFDCTQFVAFVFYLEVLVYENLAYLVK